ncbi:putative alkaline shock family protein YloU [Lactobacillus colini]|uniref:Alkaline shock family protein YloU n=1 Tax=Lactobacillus colini TaxID=1819254 RepID=A0ABS4MB79_9LACO|nr:Asp23/Gls24 family envelope stress response protein [Lactobacillus colini]MBP2056918.1 putative alkaline shock family protein YloU [Lactobacillus colini]
MADNSTILLSSNENGDETRVDLSVLEVILGIAARKVDGVSEMRGSLKAGIDLLFGRTNHGKGVSLKVDEDKLTADVYVYLDYGVNVPQVAMKLQKKLTLQLEQMTNLKLENINIHVVGLISEEDKSSAQADTELFAANTEGEAQD